MIPNVSIVRKTKEYLSELLTSLDAGEFSVLCREVPKSGIEPGYIEIAKLYRTEGFDEATIENRLFDFGIQGTLAVAKRNLFEIVMDYLTGGRNTEESKIQRYLRWCRKLNEKALCRSARTLIDKGIRLTRKEENFAAEYEFWNLELFIIDLLDTGETKIANRESATAELKNIGAKIHTTICLNDIRNRIKRCAELTPAEQKSRIAELKKEMTDLDIKSRGSTRCTSEYLISQYLIEKLEFNVPAMQVTLDSLIRSLKESELTLRDGSLIRNMVMARYYLALVSLNLDLLETVEEQIKALAAMMNSNVILKPFILLKIHNLKIQLVIKRLDQLSGEAEIKTILQSLSDPMVEIEPEMKCTTIYLLGYYYLIFEQYEDAALSYEMLFNDPNSMVRKDLVLFSKILFCFSLIGSKKFSDLKKHISAIKKYPGYKTASGKFEKTILNVFYQISENPTQEEATELWKSLKIEIVGLSSEKEESSKMFYFDWVCKFDSLIKNTRMADELKALKGKS